MEDLGENTVSLDEAKTTIFNWMASSPDSYAKVGFLKDLLSLLSADEASNASLVALYKKRSKRKTEGRDVAGKKAKERVEVEAKEEGEAVTASLNVTAPPSSSSELRRSQNLKPWWRQWETEGWVNVVAVDVEGVQSKSGPTLPATIAICDFYGRPIKKWTIQHAKGSFYVGYVTRCINGFEEDSLVNGDDMQTVLQEVKQLLNNKLVLFCAAGQDIVKLGLKSQDLQYFDIQSHWFRKFENEHGVIVQEPHGLASIYRYYYPNSNFQNGSHEPMDDAIATMRLFREQYLHIKVTNIDSKFNYEPFNNIQQFVPVWKKILKRRSK